LENWNLIAKRISGNTSQKEDQEFDLWLKHDPANEAAFKETEVLWNSLSGLNVPVNADVNAEWDKFLQTIENDERQKIHPSPVRRFALIAAALAITIVASVTLARLLTGSGSDAIPVADNMIIAEPFSQVSIFATDTARLFTLPDSSAVFLNKHSSARYLDQFAGPYRIVHLEGEALFDVQKNERPFIVFAGETEIRVLGTSFNIKCDKKGETVELTVIEGTVSFKEKGATVSSEIKLTKNERITYDHKTHATQRSFGSSAEWWKKFEKETRNEFKNLLKKIKIR
jgi:transmembrane sensor